MGADSVVVEGYDDFRRIGAGGFSTVYRAEQIDLGREVAIKVLDTRFSDPSDLRTFERECRVLGRLSRHPHIVTVYSAAVADDGRRCIVMELYVDSARQRLDRNGPGTAAEILRLGVKIGGALQAVHDSEILHRDMKPHNILYSDYDEPALADFGVSTIDDEKSITAASAVSVAYAAPELLDDRPASVASDVYSLGATLYHLLTGEPPFVSAHLPATISRIMNEPPPVIDRPDVPALLGRLLGQCLAKDAADRPASAASVVDELRGIQVELGLEPTGLAARRRPDAVIVTDETRDDDATVAPPGGATDARSGVDTDSGGSGPSMVESFWPEDWRPVDTGAEDTIARPTPRAVRSTEPNSEAVERRHRWQIPAGLATITIVIVVLLLFVVR